MAEENQGDTIVMTHTQADIDSAVSSRLTRANSAHDTAMGEKDSSIAELTAQINGFKANAEEGKKTKLTASEHTQALEIRIQQMEDNAKERDLQILKQSEDKVVSDINSLDKDSIAKAGFNPKFSDMVLAELHKSRTLENGVAFYKDSTGAQLEQSAVIEALKAQYPEFITINRAAGNAVTPGNGAPDADHSQESIEQFRARRETEGHYK